MVIDFVDMVLFVVDVMVGVILIDEYVVKLLCKSGKFVFFVVNKIDDVC